MKIDLIVAGAIISEKQASIINDVINSIDDKYEWNKKTIIMDGLKPDTGFGQFYEDYKTDIELANPSYELVELDKCIFFRDMIYSTLNKSDADWVLIIQDDVLCPKNIDIKEDIEFIQDNSDCKIISYPHKVIPDKGHHWFEIIEKKGKYLKTHGWSERIFLAEKNTLKSNLKYSSRKGKKRKMFIEYIYHNDKNQKGFNSTKEDYWASWGCYMKNDTFHKHLVAKRPKGHAHFHHNEI